MKKLLGISLVAVLAVSPLMANAAIPAGESGLESNAANVAIASAGTYYAGKTISDADRAATASAAYVKGAYNDAISAVNKVAADAASATSSGITSAINGLDATVSQAAGTDGLALQVVEENGVITGVTGSIAANTYDAYGAATTAETNAKNYADGLASNYDAAGSAATAEQNAKNYADGLASNYDAAGAATTAETNAKAYTDTEIQKLDASVSQTAGTDGLALSVTEVDGKITGVTGSIAANTYDAYGAAANAVAALGNVATQEGVENTIETATITANVASQSVSGYVPVMVNWGDSTANNTSAVALAGGATAGGTISNVSISATYAEPVAQPETPTPGA